MPCLIEADDGYEYVVKFSNNPQGLRILINETVSILLLHELGIWAPEAAYVELDRDFVAANPEMSVGRATPQVVRPALGLHFGSQHPSKADPSSVYDFVPDIFYKRLYNRWNFDALLVFDKWVSNSDGRQAIFFRARLPGTGESTAGVQWLTYAIDNGHAFQGSDWTFRDSPVQGVYARTAAYGRHISMLKFWPWIDIVSSIKWEFIQHIPEVLPETWMATQERPFEVMLHQLYHRIPRLPSLISESVDWLHRRTSGRIGFSLPSRSIHSATRYPLAP